MPDEKTVSDGQDAVPETTAVVHPPDEDEINVVFDQAAVAPKSARLVEALPSVVVLDIEQDVAPEPIALHRSENTAHSLLPVGIDMPRADGTRSADAEATDPPLGLQRHPRTPLVIGSLAVCGVILLIAAVRLVQHSGEAPSAASSPEATVTPVTSVAPQQKPAENANVNGAEGPAVWSNSFPGTEALSAPAAPSPTKGTVRLQRPARPDHVWLDGAKISAASSVVTCGAHEVRVGAKGHPHEIDVPCGGEIPISQ